MVKTSNNRIKPTTLFKSQEGIALAYVLIIFTVIMILISAIATIHSANFRQAKYQENQLRTYYLALSGVELTVAALLHSSTGDIERTAIYQYADTSRPDLDLEATEVIQLDGDTIEITINRVIENGRPMVRIESKGTLADHGSTYTLELLIDARNPNIRYWK